MTIIFFSAFFFLLYTFIGYPLLLRLVKKDPPITIKQNSELPDITVVLCIYNSADILKARIENILNSDYPIDKLRILVVSDGSTDQPELVINALNSPSIEFIQYEKNQGKSFALNYSQQFIKTSLVAFADVRQTFEPQALKYLSSGLADDSIGAISGNLKIQPNGNSEDPGLYWRYEKSIRIKESDLHSLLGVTGAIYMAKTSLLPKIPSNSLLDDMYVPLSIVKQGYKIKFCEQAVAYDIASSTTEEEFTRKVRTLAGNYQLIQQLPWLLSFRRNPLFFQFISHKVARLIMPVALIIMLLSSLAIESPMITMFYWAQVVFYSYTFTGFLLKDYNLPLVNTCISFCSLNLAALVATWKYFTVKDITTLWKKH